MSASLPVRSTTLLSIGRCTRPFSDSVPRKYFLHGTDHNKGCGLSQVPRSWFLKRDIAVEFFRCFFSSFFFFSFSFQHHKPSVVPLYVRDVRHKWPITTRVGNSHRNDLGGEIAPRVWEISDFRKWTVPLETFIHLLPATSVWSEARFCFEKIWSKRPFPTTLLLIMAAVGLPLNPWLVMHTCKRNNWKKGAPSLIYLISQAQLGKTMGERRVAELNCKVAMY